jgi:hypothetical protein
VKVSKVGVDLDNPVRDAGRDRCDIDILDSFGEERLDLHESDDVVKNPRQVEEYGTDG